MTRDIAFILDGRIGKKDLRALAEWASIRLENRNRLFELAFCDSGKISDNALWCITHLKNSDAVWLQSLQDFFIDTLLKENTTARRRMLFQILRDQEYHADCIRVDFLDYCMSNINSECESYAIRCFSLYIAIKICRHYPELLAELKERIGLLSHEPLSPGMRCAVRKVSDEIRALSV
ncbi:MAG: hypothetical protein K2K45_02285 [Muribaculaceae bacterium]|nr:hypothetical protein [Muribaculaceae bacterium]